MINIQQLVFYFTSIALLFSAMMVIGSRHPVRGVLFLVLTFFFSSILWMLMQAEFLALTLIFVYVGAVMTLFLFVVMMLNIDLAPKREGFVRYLPFGILIIVMLVGLMLLVIGPKHFNAGEFGSLASQPANYSNVKELGKILYTQYMYPFETASAVLLVAIIAAISLAFRGRRHDTKVQQVMTQIDVCAKDRVQLVNLISEQGPKKS